MRAAETTGWRIKLIKNYLLHIYFIDILPLVAAADKPGTARAATWSLAVVILLLLALPLVRMGMAIDIDFGEAWNAYIADSVRAGEPVYRPFTSLAPNNYPPLSFYLLAGISAVTDTPVILAGRLLSLLALFIVAIEIFAIGRLLDASKGTAAFGGLLFVALVSIASARYVAMNDPQLVAHAVIEPGLLLLWRWPPNRHRLTLVNLAVLCTAGLFIKHNLIALPLTITVALALESWGLLVSWLMVAGSAGVAMAGFWSWQSHGLFLSSLLMPRRYALGDLVHTSLLALMVCAVPLLLLAVRFRPEEKRERLLLIYLAIALVVAVIFSGGSGADINMFFSAFVAVALCVTAALKKLEARSTVYGPTACAVVAWLALALPWRALTPGRYEELRERERATARDVLFLRATTGQAFCERMMVCYLAGKPLVLQPYFSAELAATGAVAATRIRQPFDNREFAAIQLDRPVDTPPRPVSWFTPPPADHINPLERDAILVNYRLVFTSLNGAFYVPRDEGERAATTDLGDTASPNAVQQ